MFDKLLEWVSKSQTRSFYIEYHDSIYYLKLRTWTKEKKILESQLCFTEYQMKKKGFGGIEVEMLMQTHTLGELNENDSSK